MNSGSCHKKDECVKRAFRPETSDVFGLLGVNINSETKEGNAPETYFACILFGFFMKR